MHTQTTRRRALTAFAALGTAFAGLLGAGPAIAQNYPTRPITIVVAYPAGGDTDVLARLIAEKLALSLGQPVVVENRTGAAGTIGTAYVAKAAPDGYTLLLAPNTIAITPHVLKGVAGAQVDPATDLTAISQLASQSLFVVATTASGVTSMKDLVASVKTGKIQTYASPGNGSPMHILAELFDKSAGVKITQVPYRGSVPAVADLVGGQVPMMYSTLGPVAQHIKSGKLIPLAVADARRSAFLPDVPTLAELGFKGAEVGAWQALMGPKGMAPELVTLLNQRVQAILKMPDVMTRMEANALAPTGAGAAAMSRLVQSDFQRYGQIVKEFGIQAN